MSLSIDHLYQIFSSSKFLNMEGLSGEVPIFIQTYQVQDEDPTIATIQSLASRLRNEGIKVTTVDLYQLLLQELREEGLFDDIVNDEQDFDRSDLLETLQNYADPSTRLAQRLAKEMSDSSIAMTFVTGIGHIFPFMRTNDLMDSIQPMMMNHPLVIFFPGDYTYSEEFGYQLRLFGTLQPKGYYRAFNLDQYQPA